MKRLPVVIAFCFCSFGCDRKSSVPTTISSGTYRNDLGPILKRFPNLPPPVNAKWCADVLNKGGSNWVPGPSAYWMKGYVQCDPNKIREMAANYEWVDASSKFSPAFQFDGKENQKDWKSSKDFTSKIKGDLFMGEIYVNVDSGLIYFDIQGE